MLTRLYARIPNARIVLIGMPFKTGSGINRDENTDLDIYYQYKRNAIKEIGRAYGYPYIDLRELCGWNRLNATTYLIDTIHPNAAGGKRIAEVMIGFYKTIYNK